MNDNQAIQILEQQHIIGLTARAYVAAMAMQGILSDSDQQPYGNETVETFAESIADSAVMYADALIARLTIPPVTEATK